MLSFRGRVGGGCGCPTVGAGVVSPAGIEPHPRGTAAPDDHFTAGPHCCVSSSGSGRSGRAGRRPRVRARVISAAGVEIDEVGEAAVSPPHTIISLPLQTAVCTLRPAGALVVLVAVQLSVLGLYLPPVSKEWPKVPSPPHTIISLPLHTPL